MKASAVIVSVIEVSLRNRHRSNCSLNDLQGGGGGASAREQVVSDSRRDNSIDAVVPS